MDNEDFYGNLYLQKEDKSQVTYELSEQYTKIGNHPSKCQVQVEHPDVGMIDCIIEYDKKNHFVLVKNNSKKDIYINETKLASKKDSPLRDQDTINLKDLKGKTTLCFLYRMNKKFLKRDQIDAGSKDEVLDVQNGLEDLKMNDKLKEDHLKAKTIGFFEKNFKIETFTKVEKDTKNQADVIKNQQVNPGTKELLEKIQSNQKESNQKPEKQEEEVNPFQQKARNCKFCR